MPDIMAAGSSEPERYRCWKGVVAGWEGVPVRPPTADVCHTGSASGALFP